MRPVWRSSGLSLTANRNSKTPPSRVLTFKLACSQLPFKPRHAIPLRNADLRNHPLRDSRPWPFPNAAPYCQHTQVSWRRGYSRSRYAVATHRWHIKIEMTFNRNVEMCDVWTASNIGRSTPSQHISNATSLQYSAMTLDRHL